ncbi:hypothetical protein [uncultured Limosilactobacillus sp.]|uniref:hypothetical protein n=1 Tax=uncultured Limosilactobacillus sp. TaxID=2837629 RepID=UPI00258E5AB4|nr:hypothetical protein [uncultured Limosilactobacillus sp.]
MENEIRANLFAVLHKEHRDIESMNYLSIDDYEGIATFINADGSSTTYKVDKNTHVVDATDDSERKPLQRGKDK